MTWVNPALQANIIAVGPGSSSAPAAASVTSAVTPMMTTGRRAIQTIPHQSVGEPPAKPGVGGAVVGGAVGGVGGAMGGRATRAPLQMVRPDGEGLGPAGGRAERAPLRPAPDVIGLDPPGGPGGKRKRFWHDSPPRPQGVGAPIPLSAAVSPARARGLTWSAKEVPDVVTHARGSPTQPGPGIGSDTGGSGTARRSAGAGSTPTVQGAASPAGPRLQSKRRGLTLDVPPVPGIPVVARRPKIWLRSPHSIQSPSSTPSSTPSTVKLRAALMAAASVRAAAAGKAPNPLRSRASPRHAAGRATGMKLRAAVTSIQPAGTSGGKVWKRQVGGVNVRQGGKVWIRPGSSSPVSPLGHFSTPRPLAAIMAARALSLARSRGVSLPRVASKGGQGTFAIFQPASLFSVRGRGRSLSRGGGRSFAGIAGGRGRRGALRGGGRGGRSILSLRGGRTSRGGRGGRGRGRSRSSDLNLGVKEGVLKARRRGGVVKEGVLKAAQRLIRMPDGLLRHVVVLGAPGAARKLQAVNLPPTNFTGGVRQAAGRGGIIRLPSHLARSVGGARRPPPHLRLRRTPSMMTWRRPGIFSPRNPSGVFSPRSPGSGIVKGGSGSSSPGAAAAALVRARALSAARIHRLASSSSAVHRVAAVRKALAGIGIRMYCLRYCLTGGCDGELVGRGGGPSCPFIHDPAKVSTPG